MSGGYPTHCSNCMKLHKEIASLKAQLASLDNEPLEDSAWWHTYFSPAEIALLTALIKGKGKVVGKADIEACIPSRDHAKEREGIKIVDVFVCKIRAKLKKIDSLPDSGIGTSWGRGYYATPELLEAIREAA